MASATPDLRLPSQSYDVTVCDNNLSLVTYKPNGWESNQRRGTTKMDKGKMPGISKTISDGHQLQNSS